MTRLEMIRAAATTAPPRGRRAAKQPGDTVGHVRCEPGMGWAEAVAVARTREWWPRVRSKSPTRSQGWWCWVVAA